MSNLASHRILNDCSCNDATSRILIIPLSTAGCIFECEKCHAMQLFNLLESKHLSCLAESISQFDYQPGWSDGKFLVCYGNKLALDGGSELCGNENPEAFRYVKRMPCRYKYCQSCHTCVPISDYDTCTNSGSSSSCNSNAVSSSACPRCGDAMEWNDTQTESTEAAAHVGKPRQVQPVPDELGAIELYEQAELEEACRVCIACGGALPLKRVRSFTRTREHEAQAEEEKAKQSCNMCGGGLKHGRGLSFVKCTLCKATADIEVWHDCCSSIDEDPVVCHKCNLLAAYRDVAWYAAYAQCTNCGKLVIKSNLASVDCSKIDSEVEAEAGTSKGIELASGNTQERPGDNVACKQCKNSELVFLLDGEKVVVTCSDCGESVITIESDDIGCAGVSSKTSCSDEEPSGSIESERNVDVSVSSSTTTSSTAVMAEGPQTGDPRYVKLKVESVQDVAIGDHIAVVRNGDKYEHHMIVEQVVVEKNEFIVIEYIGEKETQNLFDNLVFWKHVTVDRGVYQFKPEDTLHLCVYQHCDDPEVVLDRAYCKLSELKYNVGEEGSEHFAVWCKTAESGVTVARVQEKSQAICSPIVIGGPSASSALQKQPAGVPNVNDNLAGLLAQKLKIRTDSVHLALSNVVQWAHLACVTIRKVVNCAMSWIDGCKLIVFDLVRRAATTIANLGVIQVSGYLALILRGCGVPPLLSNFLAIAGGTLAHALCSNVAGKLGQL